MSDQHKVFLVSSGEWDYYGVHAAYSTRENAALAIARMRSEDDDDDDYQIEEFDLDHDIEARKSNLSRMTVRIHGDLEVDEIIERDAVDGRRAVEVSETTDVWDNKRGRRGNFIFVTLWAKDDASAIRMACEEAERWVREGKPQ